ncbi:class I SAM-dependent methyltransferase [Streptomyces sp. NPDC016562]|uniref:class I SAM-dependent methyltransferase n=1 Tax=Streptomyces sp. NPDC016562 TaxID=3364966 RepID=UPI0036F4F17A
MSTPIASTAPYYARYRPPYPAELYELLADRFALDGSQTVLDLGAGPGTLALALAPLVDQVYAVDTEPAMLAEGCRLAGERGRRNISWLTGDAACLPRLCLPRIDLCVIGRAFHRMDRARVLADLDTALAPRGGVVVITSPAGEEGPRPPWWAVVEEVCARFLGPGHGARSAPGGGAGGTPEGADDADDADDEGDADDMYDHLAKSPFSRVETIAWGQPVRYTVDQLVGLQFSFARSSPARLGDRKDAFASELRRALLDHDPRGGYALTVPVRAALATRPRT